MELAVFNLGPLGTNSYLLHDGKNAAMIDVGGQPTEVLVYLNSKNLTLTDILVTHMHFDHILGVADLAGATGAKVQANSQDSYWLADDMNGAFPMPKEFKFDELAEGDIEVLGLPCKVMSVPGHTPGSLAYYFKDLDAVFVGDVLFYRSVGRTDLPGGETETLMNSIKQKIYTLPDNTTVYPGHEIETSVGDEKKANSYVRG